MSCEPTGRLLAVLVLVMVLVVKSLTLLLLVRLLAPGCGPAHTSCPTSAVALLASPRAAARGQATIKRERPLWLSAGQLGGSTQRQRAIPKLLLNKAGDSTTPPSVSQIPPPPPLHGIRGLLGGEQSLDGRILLPLQLGDNSRSAARGVVYNGVDRLSGLITHGLPTKPKDFWRASTTLICLAVAAARVCSCGALRVPVRWAACVPDTHPPTRAERERDRKAIAGRTHGRQRHRSSDTWS